MATPTFGDRLREFRKRVPMTQQQLADAIEVDFTYISKIESGKAPPPARDTIARAGKALKLTPDEVGELFRLADKLPSEVVSFFAQEPDALRLFRTIRGAPAREQEKLLKTLIEQAERQHLKRDRRKSD